MIHVVGWPELARENAGHPIIFELQINKNAIFGTYFTKKVLMVYPELNLTGCPAFYLTTLYINHIPFIFP